MYRSASQVIRPLAAACVIGLAGWGDRSFGDRAFGDPPPQGEPSGEATAEFWAYRPPRGVAIPAVRSAQWPKRLIDHFVLAKLEHEGLAPSPDASPEVLIRRLHFDLIGLPPSPEVTTRFVERFATVGADAAIATEVDGLLASPLFGERWGRHWLDVARFGESSGTEANISFPYAWRYRDYVIDAFNRDLPFDRFLTEQVAGDLLACDTSEERARLLIATGFLALGPKNLDAVDERQFRADVIDEQIDTVTRAVLGTSVACARCHDHKSDPFSMEDYYALAGIFASSKTYFGTAVSPANRIGGDPLRLPDDANQKVLHASVPIERVRKLQEQLAALRAEQAEMDEAKRAMFAGQEPKKRFTLTDALRVFWQSGGVEGELEKVSAQSGAALPLALGVLEGDKVVDATLQIAGDIHQAGAVVARAFPKALRPTEPITIPPDSSGRLELARWLVSPDHPLVSRVIVNRVWRHVFGSGIVATVDNFGATGQPPSHPELLDHLAVTFVRDGWSIKRLARELLLSRTYRQASTYHAESFRHDPDNRLLWRFPKRRLEAEAIRDAMLAVADELDVTRPEGSLVGRVIGDRPISLIGLDQRLPADLDGSVHRSVYLPVIRDRLPDVLELFDFAEPSLVTGNRETTNVPIQALYLLNSPFVQGRSEAFAKRLRQLPGDDAGRVVMAFRLCFGRDPDGDELASSLRFLAAANDTGTPDGEASAPADDAGAANGARGWSTMERFCQALLCTAEFRNLD